MLCLLNSLKLAVLPKKIMACRLSAAALRLGWGGGNCLAYFAAAGMGGD